MTDEEKRIKNRESTKRWKANNPEKVKAQVKRYHLRHQEERKLYFRTRYRMMKQKAEAYDKLINGEAEK